MKIPSNRQWTQDNSGDSLGILSSTTNMAMDMAGRATLARKPVWILGTNQDADFGYPLCINYFNDQYVVLTDDQIFTFSAPDYNTTDLTHDPNVGLNADAVVFNGLYTVSTDTSIYTWNGGTLSGDWDDQGVALTTDLNHPLEVFGTSLAVGNGNTVLLVSTAYATTQTLTLPTEQRVVTMRAVGDYLYIGTKNINGGNAKVYIWNGDSTLFDYECDVGASWVFALTPYLSSVAAITSEGQLGLVNGTSFEELAGLPVYYDPYARWQGSGGLLTNGKVFNRGICTIGNTIYLNIDGDVSSGFIPDMKSGIWVYDPAVGLYHRASVSQDEFDIITISSRSGDVLTIASPHGLKTGDSITFSGITGLTGVSNGVTYYAKVESTTTLKVAQTRKALLNENYVTLGGTPTTDKLRYTPNTDYGSLDITSGPILPVVYEETPDPNLNTEILWGGRFEKQDGTASYGLFTFSDNWNIGSFTLQRIYTENVDQNWKELYNFIDGLTLDNEEVVVKIQTRYEPQSIELSGVWMNENTLNNYNAEDISAWSDIEKGDEIVIVDGYGRGWSAHVTDMSTSSATKSLTLDESIGTANGRCTLYYTSFKKVGQTLTADNKDKEKIKSTITSASPWVAIKVELRGYGISVNTMELSNAVNKSTK